METWKEQGIPLHIVLRGVEKSFDSFEAKPRKRSVKSLLYCQEEVEAQYAEWLEARVGASPAAGSTGETGETTEADAAKMPFSFAALSEHLKRSHAMIAELAASREKAGEDNLSEALKRAATLLEDIEKDFLTSASFDARRLEDSLSGLERMLADSLFLTVAAGDLEAMKVEIKTQLKPYRSQMDSAAYDQMLNNFLLKRLREKFAVPRLSLFHL